MVSPASLRARCMKNSSWICDAAVGIVLRIAVTRPSMGGKNMLSPVAIGVQSFAYRLPKVIPVTTSISCHLWLNVVRSVVSS